MAATDFTADVAGNVQTKTLADPDITNLDAKHQSNAKEKELLVLIDVVRAYMENLKTGQEARIARLVLNRMAAEIMTSTAGYADTANVTAAADRAKKAALAFYGRDNISGMVEDANPVLDPNSVFE